MSLEREVEAGSETSGSECSILMIPLASIAIEQPSFQFSLLSSLKHTLPPANTWKCSNPSIIQTSGGSQGYVSVAFTRILQFPSFKQVYSLPEKIIVHSPKSSAPLLLARMMALIAGSTFSSSSSYIASMASSYQFFKRFTRSSLAINTYIKLLYSQSLSLFLCLGADSAYNFIR